MTVTAHPLHPLDVGPARVAYTDSGGSGPPLLLVHAGVLSSWFVPLAAEPALAGHRVVRLVRAGYTGDPPPASPLGVADHAAHAAAVLDTLGIDRAHVVAHSSGTVIALQLALDRPELVAGLVLSEPPLIDALVDPADARTVGSQVGPVIGRAIGAAAAGDLALAYDTFMDAICGPEHRAVLAAALGPDAPALAERESRFFFADEAGQVARWTFDATAAARVRQPALVVRGGASPPVVHRLVDRLAGMLPSGRVATVDGEDHLLPLRSPGALAGLVAGSTA